MNFASSIDREEIMHWCKIICNIFLASGFGCVQGDLGFQRRIVSPIFGWECLHMTTMETSKNIDGDAMVFMVLMFLFLFLLFGMCMLLWILLDAG